MIGRQVRIILVAADFGKEITTTVLWLNEFEGMDVRCVRLVPYQIDGKVLIDITEVIPLPEAREYEIRIRQKQAAQTHAQEAGGRDLTRYYVVVAGVALLPALAKRHAIRTLVEQLHARGAALSRIRELLAHRQMRVVDGCHTSADGVLAALLEADSSGASRHRWFVEYPLIDEAAGKTYVLSNQWGQRTVPTMQRLVEEFPETDVTFRAADAEE